MSGRILGSTVSGSRVLDFRAEADRCALVVVFPRRLEQVFPLSKAELIIGRDPGREGRGVDDPTVSRQHAALTWNPRHGTHAVRDLGSRNGTRLDGIPLHAEGRALVNGSVLRLGDVLLTYEHLAPGLSEVQVEAGAAQVSREAVPGNSGVMCQLRASIARAATDPAAVLILGETGTGKERIAHELHRLSGRNGRFVALNCAALSPQIVEAQLFGHVKGAFTGATDAQVGLFRAAHGGTLFLDEVGDLPLDLQPKLLRALQEGEILPVGATQPVQVDVRVVAATHKQLARSIEDGTFREDLYARISTWELVVPPLRERRSDLLAWLDRLHARWRAERKLPKTELSWDATAAETLLRFNWTLNLRGLERLVHETGASGAVGATIGRAALPSWLRPTDPGATDDRQAEPVPPPPPSVRAVTRKPTSAEFVSAFAELDGSVHGLAKRFGRDRRQIYRWIESYRLARPPLPRSEGSKE